MHISIVYVGRVLHALYTDILKVCSIVTCTWIYLPLLHLYWKSEVCINISLCIDGYVNGTVCFCGKTENNSFKSNNQQQPAGLSANVVVRNQWLVGM